MTSTTGPRQTLHSAAADDVLDGYINHHAKEEKNECLPEVRQVFGEFAINWHETRAARAKIHGKNE